MTSYSDKGTKPEYGALFGFDHVHWWVGNAKQAAQWYIARFGFSPLAYRGLETGSRDVVTHVVGMGRIVFAFSSPLNPPGRLTDASATGEEINTHLAKHGDGVKDVAFAVADARKLFASAVARGATVVREPTVLEDEHGAVVVACVKTYGDTVHSFIQRTTTAPDGSSRTYSGAFLPGFTRISTPDPLSTITPPVGLDFVDHCVGNMPDKGMLPTVEWYERTLQFHRFWSVDDSQIHTDYSSLRSIVMADYDEVIKMPINEPAKGLRKSQIQEYVDYYGGSGVQHIALNTRNILNAIMQLRARGVEFLRVPDTYYDALKARLATSSVRLKEDLAAIQALNILVDFDDHGYLLQLFTAPLQDRPTVFLEVIQREGCSGFGAGNFKSLFESIERAQALRGNLTAEASVDDAARSSTAAVKEGKE